MTNKELRYRFQINYSAKSSLKEERISRSSQIGDWLQENPIEDCGVLPLRATFHIHFIGINGWSPGIGAHFNFMANFRPEVVLRNDISVGFLWLRSPQLRRGFCQFYHVFDVVIILRPQNAINTFLNILVNLPENRKRRRYLKKKGGFPLTLSK